MTINPMMSGKMAYEASSTAAETDELSRRATTSENDELNEVCKEFEAIFVKMMLDSMRNTLSEDTLIPKNQGEKLFEDELYTEYAKNLSNTANLGIAEMMYDQLSSKSYVNPSDILDISG